MPRGQQRCWGVEHATIAQLAGRRLDASDENLLPWLVIKDVKRVGTYTYLKFVVKHKHGHLYLSLGIRYYTNYQTCGARPLCSQEGQEYGNLVARLED